MYHRKSRLESLIIMALDCICITVSLILANYIRSGSLFRSDNERMDFSMLLVQPSAAALETSSSFRGVPLGLLVSHLISPS